MADFENYVPSDTAGEGGAAGNEQAKEQAREQMAEQFRQASAKAAAARRDEQKTKKRDTSLAGVISGFIKGDVDEQILNTILSLLKQEVSGEFVLGVISIYYPNAKKAIYEEAQEELLENPRVVMESRQLTMTIAPQVQEREAQAFDENNLPNDVKVAINTWVQDMMYTAFLHPMWLLPKVFHKEEVNTTVIQLSSFILTRYLAALHIKGDFERIHQFSAFIVTGVIKKTHEHVYGSKRLSQSS